jgi:steroid 5-alpha reductase family enzyme
MNIKQNLKAIITNIIGLSIWVITLIMWYCDKVDMIWEGTAGLIAGGIFFLLPDTFLKDLLKRFLNKKV